VRVAASVDVPFPEPTSASASAIGRANRRTDTQLEVALRSALHARGLRFRKDHLVRAGETKARVDLCFTRARVAVFVDGCFWHVCPQHHHAPKSNSGYWGPKLQANIDRDRRVTAAFLGDGWAVARCWEHEDPMAAADRIEVLVRGRSVRR